MARRQRKPVRNAARQPAERYPRRQYMAHAYHRTGRDRAQAPSTSTTRSPTSRRGTARPSASEDGVLAPPPAVAPPPRPAALPRRAPPAGGVASAATWPRGTAHARRGRRVPAGVGLDALVGGHLSHGEPAFGDGAIHVLLALSLSGGSQFRL